MAEHLVIIPVFHSTVKISQSHSSQHPCGRFAPLSLWCILVLYFVVLCEYLCSLYKLLRRPGTRYKLFRIISWRIIRWWSGVVVSALASINEVNQRRARLVLRWVTVSGSIRYVTSHPGQLSLAIPSWVGAEYQSKGGDALRLGSKGRYGSCVGGR